jgi:hypothetical protein
MIRTLYDGLTEKLAAIKNSADEPLFRHIDLWNQNVEFIEQEIPFEMPAAFIEFMPVEWQTLGMKAQQADLTFRIHCVTQWRGSTHHGAAAPETAVDYLHIPTLVLKSLQGMMVEGSGQFTRVRSVINHNHAEIVDSTEYYRGRIEERSAMEVDTPVTVTPKLQI